MNAILTWIVEAIFSVIGYGLIAAVVIAVFGMLWPRIAAVVKFMTGAVALVVPVMMFANGEIWLGILSALGALVGAGFLFAIYQLLDNAFGVLVTEEEADKMCQ